MASYIPYKSLVPGALKPPSYKNIYGGITGQGMEIVNFVNANNQVISIPFFNGQPTYPIPKGYKRYDPIKKTTTTQPKQQSMLDYGGDGGEYGATESAQDTAFGQAISESGGKVGQLSSIGSVGSIGKSTGVASSMLDPFGVVSGRPTQMSDVLGVIGMATGFSGFGMLGTVGNALNNAGAIHGIANNMGMNVSVLDAISASVGNFQNSTLGKAMLKDPVAFQNAKNAFVSNSLGAMIDAGYTVGMIPGGGYVTIDEDGRYSYQSIKDFLDVGFRGKKFTTLNKNSVKNAVSLSSAIDKLDNYGLTMDPNTLSELADNTNQTPEQVAQNVIDQAAMGLEPFGGSGDAPAASQPAAGVGYGSGALGMTSEEAEKEEEAMAGDESGSEGGGEGTYCCTASWKRNQMSIKEVKELREWHKKQSQIWQDGYNIWGKWVADNLVAKSDWSASVVKDIHTAFVKKKYTFKGIIGIAVIVPGVYVTGFYKRIKNYGRVFQSNS